MRYLYGDSFPFQLHYNFLSTLETFVTCAVQAVAVDRETALLRQKHAAGRAERQKALAELEAFHGTIAHAVQTCARLATTAATSELARQVSEFAARLLEESRRDATAGDERDEAAERDDAVVRKNEAKKAIESFLLNGRLPTLGARVRMQLVEGRNEIMAVFTNPQHIVTSFAIKASEVPAWRRERRVSDFAKNVSVQVGVKKSLFSRSMQPEVVQLDDFVVGGFDLADDAAEIRLRKRADTKDALVFHVRRVDGEVTADVVREGEDGAMNVEVNDRVQIEQLWQLLRANVDEVLPHKERLYSVELDGRDLFEQDAVTAFVKRLVRLFAPIVVEIAKRSPNTNELSLKHEDDTGRREELYVNKKDLLEKIATLDATGQALFAPLFAPAAEASKRDPSELDISIEPVDDDSFLSN